MDNKKWYKKFATIFWWTLTALPLIVALLYFIGYHFAFNNGMATAQELSNYHNNLIGDFTNQLQNVSNSFSMFAITSLTDMFENLFDIIGTDDSSTFGFLFGYMLSIQVYHLLFDFLVFFIHLIHNFMEKFDNEMY